MLPWENILALSFRDIRCLLHTKCHVPWQCGDAHVWWDATIWQPGQNDGPKIKHLILFNWSNPLNWRLLNLYFESWESSNCKLIGALTRIVDSLPLAAEDISIDWPACMTETVCVQFLSTMSVWAIILFRMSSVKIDDLIVLWMAVWIQTNILLRNNSNWWKLCEFNHLCDRGKEYEFTYLFNHLCGRQKNIWIHTAIQPFMQ